MVTYQLRRSLWWVALQLHVWRTAGAWSGMVLCADEGCGCAATIAYMNGRVLEFMEGVPVLHYAAVSTGCRQCVFMDVCLWMALLGQVRHGMDVCSWMCVRTVTCNCGQLCCGDHPGWCTIRRGRITLDGGLDMHVCLVCCAVLHCLAVAMLAGTS